MWNRERWTAALVVLVAGFGLAACGESLGAEANGSGVKPAKVGASCYSRGPIFMIVLGVVGRVRRG